MFKFFLYIYYKTSLYLIPAFILLSIVIIFFCLAKYFDDHSNDNSLDDEFNDNKEDTFKSDKKKKLKNGELLIKKHNNKYIDESIENIRIVGIKKPIGKWTRFVISEKLQRMIGFNFDKKHKGFWQMMIKMEAPSQGKSQGRSRGGGGAKKRH